ncbi:MAG: hypothetical protein IT201_07130 [Thermoleophilia bacterium]|nr:hypothetical protein [Thermoleophilia bacterium]
MKLVEIRSQEIRLPGHALEALERHEVVGVTHYGRRRLVCLSGEDFALVEPLLELLRLGRAVSSELLMTAEDIALERALADDREPAPAEDELIDLVLSGSGE